MTFRARTLRNAAFSSVAMYTEFALGMLTSIIIARHLGPADFGTYSAIILLVAMGVAAANSATASTAIKFVAELSGAQRHGEIRPLVTYLRHAQGRFVLAVVLIAALVLWLIGDRIAPGVHRGWLYGFLACAIALRAGYMFNISVAKGLENFRMNAIVALIAAPSNLAMIAIAIAIGASIEWLLMIFLATGVFFFAISRGLLRPLLPSGSAQPTLPQNMQSRIRRQMFYSTMIVTIGYLAASEIEVLFMNVYADPHGAGQFKVGYQLALGAATLVPGVFGAQLMPMMANATGQGREVVAHRFVASTSYLALLALPMMTFGIVLSQALIGVLYGSAYESAGLAFAVCLAGAAMIALAQGASSLLIGLDRQHVVLGLTVLFGVLKVGLDAWLIQLAGLRGALIAFFVVSAVNAFAYFALAIRESGAAPDWARIMRIAVASVLAVVPIWLVKDALPPWAELVCGGLIAIVLYPPLTLLLRCWSRSDIEQMHQLFGRLPNVLRRPAIAILSWAHARAIAAEP